VSFTSIVISIKGLQIAVIEGGLEVFPMNLKIFSENYFIVLFIYILILKKYNNKVQNYKKTKWETA